MGEMSLSVFSEREKEITFDLGPGILVLTNGPENGPSAEAVAESSA